MIFFLDTESFARTSLLAIVINALGVGVFITTYVLGVYLWIF